MDVDLDERLTKRIKVSCNTQPVPEVPCPAPAPTPKPLPLPVLFVPIPAPLPCTNVQVPSYDDMPDNVLKIVNIKEFKKRKAKKIQEKLEKRKQ